MPILKNIKFSKLDKFENPVFIATKKSDEENYKILLEYYNKILEMDIDTFSPIYHSSEFKYNSIRFFKDTAYEFKDRGLYNIKFTMNKKVKEGKDEGRNVVEKTYINCYIKSAKFIKTLEVDRGEEIEL